MNSRYNKKRIGNIFSFRIQIQCIVYIVYTCSELVMSNQIRNEIK